MASGKEAKPNQDLRLPLSVFRQHKEMPGMEPSKQSPLNLWVFLMVAVCKRVVSEVETGTHSR